MAIARMSTACRRSGHRRRKTISSVRTISACGFRRNSHGGRRASDALHDSLIDGSVTAELRYWLSAERPVRPFAEAGLGLHLISHTRIADQGLGVAFGFGTQLALGTTFGDGGRYEIVAWAHHVSNGSIKQPNDGINYFGIRFRVALP